jgi:ribonuclease T2
MRSLRLIAALLVLVAGSVGAFAQFGPGPGGRAPLSEQGTPRNEAGRFAYYALVLSWSPTHCATLRRDGYDPQCHSRDGRRFAFVLHGLWPQHERGWPEFCPTRGGNFVPRSTIDRMLDIMPSQGLVIHQYRKHGTCSGLGPDEFFDLSRKYFSKIKVPQRFERPNEQLVVSPKEVVDAFVAANPGLTPSQIVVDCNNSGNRLREVRICLSREGQFRDCGQNENQQRLCRSDRLYMPPVRAR